MVKTISLNQNQINVLIDLVESSIDAFEEYSKDTKLTKSENKELGDLYELLYELSYKEIEDKF